MRFATVAQAQAYLEGFINLERRRSFAYAKLGTARVRALLAEVGDPHQGLPCVHIAGSKGKGSVALATEALLRAAGYRVGTYTSPHLESWLERYRIDGTIASETQLLDALERLHPAAERLRADTELCPSFFDVSTVLAFLIFRAADVEAGVIEVGLGGRLDSTNVVDSRVCVLTSIQLEHTDKLGSTLEAIAGEKAGILRQGIPALYGPLAPDPEGVVLAAAVVLDAPVEEVYASDVRCDEEGMSLALPDGRTLFAGIWGRHQAHNVALAVRAAEYFAARALKAEELESLSSLRLPARLERFGDVVLDSSHTPDSAHALRETLDELRPGRPRVLVVSISRDKDAEAILQELAPGACAFIACESEAVRSRPAEELEALAWACGIETAEARPDPDEALARAREIARSGDLIVICGSIYLAGALRRRLLESPGGAG